MDHDLSFKAHIAKLVTKLCSLLRVRTILVSGTFLPLLDYGDVWVLQQNVYNLWTLIIIVPWGLLLVVVASLIIMICMLNQTDLLGLVPSYLCIYLQRTKSHYVLRSCDFSVACIRTVLAKRAFSFTAPSSPGWSEIVWFDFMSSFSLYLKRQTTTVTGTAPFCSVSGRYCDLNSHA